MMKLSVSQKNQSIVDIVQSYGKKLFSFIRSRVKTDEDAEDILQDVWYQLSAMVDKEPIEQLSAWLYKVSRNKIIDRSRKHKPVAYNDFAAEDEEGDFSLPKYLLIDDVDLIEEIEKKYFMDSVLEALEELPEKQRQVFVWNELEGMTLQEIADKTGENIKTIISRKSYAVKILKKRFENRRYDF